VNRSVLRHTALFLMRPDTTPAQQLAMLKGLAYMRFQCPSVLALDYGADVFGGSGEIARTKPWTRTPRWRASRTGPPSNYDVALMLDFPDQAALEAYNVDPVHGEVGQYNASISQAELTARVDWHYDGEPLIARGGVRHTAMFVWADDADEAARAGAIEQFERLRSAAGVESLTIGHNVGSMSTDFDLILDVQTADAEAASALVAGELYAEVMASVAPVTKYEWTARLSHVMRGL
jgi:hypothetical protein